jgi:hypothetical protein
MPQLTFAGTTASDRAVAAKAQPEPERQKQQPAAPARVAQHGGAA